MKKLIAVRCEGLPGEEVLTGFVHRGKNRQRVWTLDCKGKTREEIQQMVQEAEAKRNGPKGS